MHKNLDLIRALKDRAYYESLSASEQARVLAANPIGVAGITDQQLESVSGGLSGGDHLESTTTTTTATSCQCSNVASRIAGSHLAAARVEGHRVTPECNCVC